MRYLFVALALALFLVACSQQAASPVPPPPGDSQTPTTTGSEPPQLTGTPAPADTPAPPTATFRLVATEFSWTPNVIRIKEGTQVTLEVENAGQNTHGLAIPAFDVNKQIAPGERMTVTFVADKKGVYRFFCSVPCGSGHAGMTGEIIVE